MLVVALCESIEVCLLSRVQVGIMLVAAWAGDVSDLVGVSGDRRDQDVKIGLVMEGDGCDDEEYQVGVRVGVHWSGVHVGVYLVVCAMIVCWENR